MKPSLLLILLCFFAFGCHSPEKQQTVVLKIKPIRKADSVAKEYISWDSVKLNGTMSMVSHFKTALAEFGKPDSVITPDYSDMGETYWNGKFKYCYFKGLQLEKYHDSLAFKSINFGKSPGWFISYKNVKFDGKTTIEDFKRLFPISVEEKELHGTSMDKNQWIRIATSPEPTDDAWVFLFDRNTGKLISVDHWLDD